MCTATLLPDFTIWGDYPPQIGVFVHKRLKELSRKVKGVNVGRDRRKSR